jgi:hypothetical protein
MPSARSVRNAASLLGAAGLAGVYAVEAPGTTAAAQEIRPGRPALAAHPRLRHHTEPRPRLEIPASRPAGMPNTLGVAADAGAGGSSRVHQAGRAPNRRLTGEAVVDSKP